MENKYQGRSERQQRSNELISFITVAGLVLFSFALLILKLAQLSES
jgi:hypothetical protein